MGHERPSTAVERTGAIDNMRNGPEGVDMDATSHVPPEIDIPGLNEVLRALRETYPFLSDDALARIVGLPIGTPSVPFLLETRLKEAPK
jgi:hypothetical protein